jgi:uncharacterized repeat protein (TIGR01451 family)
MDRNRRLGGYLLALLALFGAVLVVPRAWATPTQARSGQGTVPTVTPVQQWTPPTDVPPTERPTDRPPGGDTATVLPPDATPTASTLPSTATSIPTAGTPIASGAGAALALAKQSDRLQTWPGATVWFTLTARNPGSASARQLVLEDVLPAELDPGAVVDAAATWDGRTLRGRLPVLPPGGQWVITFTATVREDAKAGKLVVNSAQVSAAGGLSARAEAYLALPPAELPAVGGGGDELRQP